MAVGRFCHAFRVAFFVMRKGLVPKQKLILDVNLMMKRGKLLGKSVGSIFSHHPPRGSGSSGTTMNDRSGFDHLHDRYEVSCTGSPNPALLRTRSKRTRSYFPCISAGPVDETDRHAAVPSRIEHSPRRAYRGRRGTPSPSPARASNLSAMDGLGSEVDSQAEEFIKRFYQELLLQCQGEENEEALARGA